MFQHHFAYRRHLALVLTAAAAVGGCTFGSPEPNADDELLQPVSEPILGRDKRTPVSVARPLKLIIELGSRATSYCLYDVEENHETQRCSDAKPEGAIGEDDEKSHCLRTAPIKLTGDLSQPVPDRGGYVDVSLHDKSDPAENGRA